MQCIAHDMLYVGMSLDMLVFREQLLIKYIVCCLTRTTLVSNYTNRVFLRPSEGNLNEYIYVIMLFSSRKRFAVLEMNQKVLTSGNIKCYLT
jgi:hypothetical protein